MTSIPATIGSWDDSIFICMPYSAPLLMILLCILFLIRPILLINASGLKAKQENDYEKADCASIYICPCHDRLWITRSEHQYDCYCCHRHSPNHSHESNAGATY